MSRTVSYEEFGVAFVRAAVTAERVKATISEIAGESIVVGPLSAGPGGAAVAKARGSIRGVRIHAMQSELVAFRVNIDVDLDLVVTIAGADTRFSATADIPVHLEVRTAHPLAIVIHTTEPKARDVRVKVSAKGIAAKIVQRAGDLDAELRRQIASHVAEMLTTPEAKAATHILVEPLIDAGWSAAP